MLSMDRVTTFLESMAAGLVRPMLIIAVLLLPLGVIGWLLHRRRKAYLAEAKEPFTELPLRPPGESLRLRIEKLGEEFDDKLLILPLGFFGATMMAIMAPKSVQLTMIVALFAILTGMSIVVGRKLMTIADELWNRRLGFMGERVVGEELNQLLASGFRVFHDVPFEKGGKEFNIDHVLVGPPGVYAVETKARRKPANIKGTERAKVKFDGNTLYFPTGGTDTKDLAQARLNAETLGKWLTKATGERVTASAILTMPGWFVERHAVGDINVLNPGEIKYSFPTHPKQPLAAAQIQRIAYQLEQRCRLEKEPKPQS